MLGSRPSANQLAAKNILPSSDLSKSKLAYRGQQLDRKKKQQDLMSRLLVRPERLELQQQGILLAGESRVANKNPAYSGITNVRNSGPNEAQVAAFASGLRDSVKDNNPTFVTKTLGTKSKSQLEREREHESGANHLQHQPVMEPERKVHAKRRLSNHMITRPNLAELQQKNIVPAFYDQSTGSEFYVFSTEDLSSPGKPLAVKTAKGPQKVESLKFMKRQEALAAKLKDQQALRKANRAGKGTFYD
jgi:hypothetical protein